jgi:hypothetical protein
MGDTPMPLDLSANLDDLVKRLAVIRAERARLEQEESSLAESIRTSVADLGTYPCANGLTLTLARNRRFNQERALTIAQERAAAGSPGLAERACRYVLTVDRERFEETLTLMGEPDLAAQCWDDYPWKVAVK